MLKDTTFLAGGLALLLATAPALAQEADETPQVAEDAVEAPVAEPVTAETVVATVDGVEITLGALIIAKNRLPQQYQQLPPEVLMEGLIDQLIQQQLLANSLDDVPGRVELSLANERRSLMAGEVVNALVAEAASEEALQAAYDAAFGGTDLPTEYNASHILVESEDEALAVAERLAGGEDFGDVAREVSTDPGSGTNGGQLGWFSAGMMVEVFQTAVESLDVGEISAPVESQFGWHVIQLNETREQQPPPFDMVAPELAAQLQEEAIQAKLDELQAAATVTQLTPADIDPAVLNDLSLLED